MIIEGLKEAYAKRLYQLGITEPTDVDAVLDVLYTIATCAIEYEDKK